MDLVKLSAVSGFALMSALVIAASSSDGRAQDLPADLTPQLPAARIQTRIDDAFRAAEPTPAFDITGPLFPPQQTAPTRAASIAPPAPWALASPSVDRWSVHIDEAARRFGVPADWVRAVMGRESGGRTHLGGRPITSSAGAMGLMQVMPGTFAEMSALHGLGRDPYDPRANILAGTAYLRAMYDRYGPTHFLAAYNAGPGRVDEHLRTGRALPGETWAYTAALQPRLFSGATPRAAGEQPTVQDLTSIDAIQALTSPASRSTSRQLLDPVVGPVFASGSAAAPATAQSSGTQRHEGLFVTLSAADRRREVTATGGSED